MALHGRDILVLKNGTAIAGARNVTVNVSCNAIQTTSETDQDWEHYTAGRKSWGFSLGCIALSSSDILNLLTVGTIVTIIIKGRSASDPGLTGSALITTAALEAGIDNVAKGSISFTGNGKLSQTT